MPLNSWKMTLSRLLGRTSHCGVCVVTSSQCHLFLYAFVCVCVCVWQSLSRVQLCDPVGCSPPGSSLQGILQAGILEWAAISFSRESARPRDQTHVSCIAGGFFTVWATREVPSVFRYYKNSIVIGEETEVHWPPTPGLYLPVQGLAYTLLLLLL